MKCFVVRRVAVIPTMCHFTVLPFFPAALYGRKWHHWLRGSKLCHVLKILKTTIRRPSVRALHARTRCKNVCFHLQGFPVFIPRMDTTINTIKLPTIDTNWSMQKTQIIPYLRVGVELDQLFPNYKCHFEWLLNHCIPEQKNNSNEETSSWKLF